MLNVVAQKSAAGAKSYFATSDYYSEGQEIVGLWGGKGAVLLGLFGKVDQRAFDALCDNLHPGAGTSLTANTKSGRRVGYDFTWSAPKSVSIAHALTGDERIVEAFRRSVSETMTEMEADMQARVRKGGEEYDRPTGNMAWAEFIHLTSRPVNGVPCPQLHAHCFTFNATFDAIESQWKAGQFGKIKGDGYYWQAVQQARFANRLQMLGYEIRKTKDAFEIAGVPESAIKKYSLRTGLIERMAERLGITNAKSKAKLAATTREAKCGTIPYPELVKTWKGQLTETERSALSGLVSKKGGPRHDDARFARFAVEHTFERQSVADERRLLTLALRRGCGEVTPEGVRAELDRQGLLKRVEQDKTWVTTQTVLAEENRMVAFAAAGRGLCKPLAGSEEIRFREERLNEGQMRAVEQVLRSPDRVIAIIRGAAGSGKTTLTKEAVAQIEAKGKQVVMLAPSAQASRGVLREEGFDQADTLARFLVDPNMQADARNGVIWLDEAGLVGSKTMAALFQAAERLDARVVLAGDRRQMASVERGAALRVLEDVAGLKVAEVTDIRRQTGEYREAVKLLAKGQGAAGLQKLDALGWVKVMPEEAPFAPVANDYINSVNHGETCLIVCPTHAEGAAITQAVRQRLLDAGKLGQDERHFDRLVPLQWTEAERGDVRQYGGEELLQFHHAAGPIKAGERVKASDSLPRIAEAARHFAVYEPASIELRAGDTIRITANGKTADGKHKLNNGANYTVRGFTAGGDIELSNGWTIGKRFGHLAHGYVNTAYAAQGRTVDHVVVCQSAISYPASSREGFYVAASRGRKSATVYTDDKQQLREAVERSSPRPSARELVSMPKPQIWRRLRQAVARMQLSAMVASKAAVHEVQRVLQPREVAYER